MIRALVYIVPVALAVYALIDFSRSLPSERLGLSRWAWLAIIILLPVLGPIVWIVLSRRAQASNPRPSSPGRPLPPRPRRRSGPVAPDDDPDFLWRLEQQQRRMRGSTPATGGTTPPTDAPEAEAATSSTPERPGDDTTPQDDPTPHADDDANPAEPDRDDEDPDDGAGVPR